MNETTDNQGPKFLDEHKEGTYMPLSTVDVKTYDPPSTINENEDTNEDLFDKTPMSLKDIGNMVRNNPDVLTAKDQRSLKVKNYEKIKHNFKKAFLIFNLKTRQIVELQAASALHAVTLIGWKLNKVKLLGEYDVVVEETKVEGK